MQPNLNTPCIVSTGRLTSADFEQRMAQHFRSRTGSGGPVLPDAEPDDRPGDGAGVVWAVLAGSVFWGSVGVVVAARWGWL